MPQSEPAEIGENPEVLSLLARLEQSSSRLARIVGALKQSPGDSWTRGDFVQTWADIRSAIAEAPMCPNPEGFPPFLHLAEVSTFDPKLIEHRCGEIERRIEKFEADAFGTSGLDPKPGREIIEPEVPTNRQPGETSTEFTETLALPDLEQSYSTVEELAGAISLVESAQIVIDDYRRSVVEIAHNSGLSWSQVGESFGISRQEAHRRFSTSGQASYERLKARRRTAAVASTLSEQTDPPAAPNP